MQQSFFTNMASSYSMQTYWNKRKLHVYIRKRLLTILITKNTNMAAISLFWNTNKLSTEKQVSLAWRMVIK